MDYMVIGISPALIMGMVGSLMFFLLTVFYHGQYLGRMNFICAMFTMAIVLIARISMEDGIEYASMFAIPLAIVTALAMAKFVAITGPLAGLSTVINLSLIAIVWWSAHKLTWDCTFIDDQQDASGEGLLQGMGFDAETVERQVDAAQPGRTAPPAPAESDDNADSDKHSGPEWYQRMIARRRRPHTPGVWVMYYAIAALPLFGVGQWMIPAVDAASRWHAFRFICVYVACALGLLLTTSFLGLRRYLRQRNLQMPLDMAGLWLGLGTVMILAVLLACMFLPRPGATLTVSKLPFGFGSPNHQRTSPHALGNDGPERPHEATRSSPRAQQQPSASSASTGQKSSASAGSDAGKQPSSPSSKQSSPGQDAQPAQSQDKSPSDSQQEDPSGSSSTPDQQPNGKSPSDPKQGPQQGQPQGQPQGSDQTTGGEEPRDSQQPGDREANKAQNTTTGGTKMPEQQPQDGPQFNRDAQQPAAERPKQETDAQQPAAERPKQEADAQQPAAERDAQRESSSPPRSQPRWNPTKILTTITSGLGNLLKLVLFAVLACVALYFAWRHREQLGQALAQLWRDLQNLWASLWGRRRVADIATETPSRQPAGPPPPSFASFRDPFASGKAERYSMEELVRYSFEALEAWGREHGCARHVDQTPFEYAQQIARRHAAIGPETQVLADLYCRLAYGREQLATNRRDHLRRLWQQLRAAPE